MRRPNISSDLQSALRDRIVSGAFSPGVRLNEVHLAQELEVSRTPLREALFRLASERLVTEIPRRGFFVARLTVDEIRELYAIRKILDPAALKMAGLPGAATLRTLRELNAKIARARQPKRIIELDDDWHLLLVSACGNQLLLGMIRQHMVRTRRYELAYMSHSKNVSVATDEHTQIIEALEQHKLALACKRLEQNMSSAEGPLIDWVRSLGGEGQE